MQFTMTDTEVQICELGKADIDSHAVSPPIQVIHSDATVGKIMCLAGDDMTLHGTQHATGRT
jgi:hypothetical protein